MFSIAWIVEAGQHGFPTVNGGVARLAGDVVFACQFVSEISPPELQSVFFGKSCVVYVTHLLEEAGVFFCTGGLKRRQYILLIFYKTPPRLSVVCRFHGCHSDVQQPASDRGGVSLS